MKTRIVYPKFWFDEKFAECKISTKLLFVYLITNDYLKLSRYSRISDRRIIFETGLTSTQLKESKKELEDLRWCFFSGEWIYHNHECAYVDYLRNEKVESAKQKEIESIPSKIVGYFNEVCLNTVQTPFKHRLNINHKLKIINNKEDESVREETKFSSIKDLNNTELVKELSNHFHVSEKTVINQREAVNLYCLSNGKRYKNYKAALMNFIRRAVEKNPSLIIKNPVNTYQPITEVISPISSEKLAEIKRRTQEIIRSKSL